MSTDADETEHDRMEKIDVRVPLALLELIDAEYQRRGYSSRSEAIRDALRDWASPPVTISDEVLDALELSREQLERGETLSAETVREQLALNDDG